MMITTTSSSTGFLSTVSKCSRWTRRIINLALKRTITRLCHHVRHAICIMLINIENTFKAFLCREQMMKMMTTRFKRFCCILPGLAQLYGFLVSGMNLLVMIGSRNRLECKNTIIIVYSDLHLPLVLLVAQIGLHSERGNQSRSLRWGNGSVKSKWEFSIYFSLDIFREIQQEIRTRFSRGKQLNKLRYTMIWCVMVVDI